MGVLEKIVRRINTAIDVVLFVLIVLMAGMIFAQVVSRYIFQSPLSWPEEITRLMLVWLTFVGGYVAFREDKHIGFDLFLKKLPNALQRILWYFTNACIMLFAFVMIWKGLEYALEFVGERLPYSGLNLGIFAYMVFPVSGVLIAMQVLLNIAAVFRKKNFV